MALELFSPTRKPSFAWDETDEFSSIVNESDRGHEESRARRDFKLRRWRLRWEFVDDADKDELRDFFEFHLGGAVTFEWDLIHARLYTSPPGKNRLTLVGNASGGSLSDGTYDVVYAYENANGETQASPIQQITLSAGGSAQQIVATAPVRFPVDATLLAVYAEAAATTPKRQGNITTPSGSITINSIAAGANPNTVNQMQARVIVRGLDNPKYLESDAGIWVVENVFREVLV